MSDDLGCNSRPSNLALRCDGVRADKRSCKPSNAIAIGLEASAICYHYSPKEGKAVFRTARVLPSCQ